jgi:hypothetical protein
MRPRRYDVSGEGYWSAVSRSSEGKGTGGAVSGCDKSITRGGGSSSPVDGGLGSRGGSGRIG